MKNIYQTLEDKGNPDQIEQEGPFLCDRKDAWLGSGYYFWESFIENAHWWGRQCYSKNGYVICRAKYTEDEEKCFNLIDNSSHIQMLRDTILLMEQKNLYKKGKTTVSRVFDYLINTLKIFHFEATRTYGVNSKSHDSKFSQQIIFNRKYPYPAYLDLCPAIQICFYKKGCLQLSSYKIVFPDIYVEGYLV